MIRHSIAMFLALAPLFLGSNAVKAATLDYNTLVGNYVASDCQDADGADGQAQAPRPNTVWDGLTFSVKAQNGGLFVTVLSIGNPDHFTFEFSQINQGPQKVSKTNADMGMSSNGKSTAITTADGVQAKIVSEYSTPIGSSGGFINSAEFTKQSSGGFLYKITEISPDPAQGPNVQWVEWRSCLLTKAN